MSPRKILCTLIFFAPAAILGQTTPDLPPQPLEAPAPAPAPATALPHIAATRPVHQSPGGGPAELQSFLDAQSELDRRRMLDKQQRTFQLEIDGRYAKALKAYCDTGYGDDRCFRPEMSKPASTIVAMPAPAPSGTVPPPPVAHPVPAEGHELPSVAQISGFGEDLSAELVFAGGKRLRVLGPGPNGPRSQLPEGETVVSIRPGEVLVSRPGDGKPLPLLFQAAAGYSGSD
jgi:hypothetical protein